MRRFDNTGGMSRRSFLRSSTAAAGGLLVALYVERSAVAAGTAAAPAFPPSAFVTIGADGRIVIMVNRIEVGQGIHTSLPMILADELDADWAAVTAEIAPVADVYKDPILGMQMVAGSTATANSYRQYRELGAKTRAMLVATAAERWRVGADRCRTENSVVYGPSGRSARYGELAADAARRPIPEKVRLKEPGELRIIGKRVRRLDGRAKVDGSQKFGLDLDLPGMKTALVARPPLFGGGVKSFDDKAARAVAGVRDIFQVPLTYGGSGVVVVADGFWPAKQARDRLKIEWDLAGVERADTAALLASYKDKARRTATVAAAIGDAGAIDKLGADRTIVAEYEFPYLAHAPMEPLNTIIRYDRDRAEVWMASMSGTADHLAIAQVLGLPPAKVTCHLLFGGGGFGRRGPLDCHLAREAAAVAKQLPGTAVKLVWTREDDIRGGYYRPMFVHRVQVGIGADGKPAAWKHVIVGQSFMKDSGLPFEPYLVKDGIDHLVVEGTVNHPYTIPNFHLSADHTKVNVPVLSWRSIGHTHNSFVVETMIDELAARAKVDPIEYRLRLLRPEEKRLISSMKLLRDKTAAWRSSLPVGRALGVACGTYYGSGIACAVDVSIENGRPRIHRATAALDCGVAVNPMTIEAQVHSGFVFGLSQLVAGGAITLADGVVEQRNFDRFTPPYMADAPVEIDVHLVPSTEAPTGMGETPVPVISPAVANALAALTGKRYRTLPITKL
ncbi:MAG: xanthine dehydrogenase family protein molybdopterin-binding subunit [Deltaproteobacteria bacterium]|nr:xanthine dehydrogenase family protein molybdopterin-binding subunit [Deltaproteobacteria bacterium]